MGRLVNTHYSDEQAINKLSAQILEIMKQNDEIVIVNIGTDRCIGDSVAPLVGTILKENNFTYPVYGTIKNPIHALNIEKNLREIHTKHPNANIIGIDACLGDFEDIGHIMIRNHPINPGKGVGKSLPPVGKYSIVGIVDGDGGCEPFTSRNIRLDLVLDIAKIISRALIKAEKDYYIINKEVAICNF